MNAIVCDKCNQRIRDEENANQARLAHLTVVDQGGLTRSIGINRIYTPDALPDRTPFHLCEICFCQAVIAALQDRIQILNAPKDERR